MSKPALTPEQFEALLDAKSNSPDSHRLKDALENSPHLAEDARLQEAIDRSLRARFVAPSADVVLAAVKIAAVSQTPVVEKSFTLPSWLGRAAAVAACIALVAYSAYRLFDNGVLGPSARDQIVTGKKRPVAKFDGPSVTSVHEALVKAGYQPNHAFSDPRAIAASVWRRTGQGLVPTAAMPAGARVLGMSEVACMSPQTLALMMQVDGKPLTVLIDKLENDRFICVERPMDITPFRQEVGGLVLYEVTPHGRPIIREFFTDPQQSKQWYESGGGF